MGSSLLPFAYVVKAENNEYYIKVGKLNNITTGINDEDVLTQKFVLEQNYPNPFNPSTTISFALPQQANVKLNVYNSLGEEVAELVNGNISAGNHQVTFDASHLSSGLYFYRMAAGSFFEVKKMILLK